MAAFDYQFLPPALQRVQHVRHVPGAYLQPIVDGELLEAFALEACCLSLDAAADGLCDAIAITFGPGGRLTVRDNARHTSLWHGPCGDGALLEDVLLIAVACRDRKRHADVGATFCQFGLGTLNAMCAWLIVELHDGQTAWKRCYRRGLPVAASRRLPSTDLAGARIRLRLDASVLRVRPWRLEGASDWLAEVRHRLPGLMIDVSEELGA